jgi:hypothetical protein
VIVAYADPPYPGHADLYKRHPDYAGEVDHAELIARLCAEYPDGWALSTASTTLQQVLALCPADVRIGAWVKPFGVFKPAVNPAYVWEPVIFRGGRRRTDRSEETVRDWCSVPITLQRGLVGAKPEGVCFWVFSMLGLQPGDELVDLFPGTGAVSRAWERWQHQLLPAYAVSL